MTAHSQSPSRLSGFSRSFWVANTLELFERFAYYGSKAILAVFVAEQVGLGPESAGLLVGSVFNTLLYFLPVLAGTVVDRYGFKKSLLACFSIFCVGYFLIGLAGLPAGKPLVDALGPKAYMIVALVITAIGGSLIKPSIVGTVARTTTAEHQVARLLDLLHAGEHRRRHRAIAGACRCARTWASPTCS